MFKKMGMFDRALGMFQPSKLMSAIFSPSSLFASGEQGAWYDPSDLTTLFQDSAGMTPVTAVEQPVGEILDKSGRGNHASQPTSAARPILSARVNLLTYTEDFQISYVIAGRPWAIGTIGGIPQGEITVNQTIAPDGTTTADLFATKYSNNSAHQLFYSGLTNPGAQITYSVYLKSAGSPYAMVGFYGTNSVYNGILVNLSTGTLLDTKGTIYGYSITPSENGFYRVSVTGTLNTTSPIPVVFLSNSATPTYDAVNRPTFVGTTESIYVWGSDLRVANDGVGIPSYQRVGAAVTATTNPAVTGVPDYDTTGFPLYLKFDGVDDCLYTPSNINFSATDKMTVWAGVRKLSDTVTNPPAAIAELTTSTASNNGAFLLSAPNTSGSASYSAISKGTAASTNTVTTYTAPITNVLSAALDIGSDGNSVKVNAGTAVTSATDQGTGNFSNAVLYVGRRGNSALFTSLNGRIYSLIVRGAESTTTQITQAETYTNSKTKAY